MRLFVHCRLRRLRLKAVDDVSFSVRARRDAGDRRRIRLRQDVTALSIMRLVPIRRAASSAARSCSTAAICWASTKPSMREMRGNDISMIFQEPMTSLNPVMTIGNQIAEAVRLHRGFAESRASAKRVDMLRLVQHPRAGAAREGISAPALGRDAPARDDRDGAGLQARRADRRRADDRARCDDPGADSRPDARSAEELGTAVILITHDLGVVAETAQRVIVMYAGKKVEEADVEALFADRCTPTRTG